MGGQNDGAIRASPLESTAVHQAHLHSVFQSTIATFLSNHHLSVFSRTNPFGVLLALLLFGLLVSSACTQVVPLPLTTTNGTCCLRFVERLCIQLTNYLPARCCYYGLLHPCHRFPKPTRNHQDQDILHRRAGPSWSCQIPSTSKRETPYARARTPGNHGTHPPPEFYSFTRTPYREKYPHLGTWLFLPDLKSKMLHPSLATLGGVYTVPRSAKWSRRRQQVSRVGPTVK